MAVAFASPSFLSGRVSAAGSQAVPSPARAKAAPSLSLLSGAHGRRDEQRMESSGKDPASRAAPGLQRPAWMARFLEGESRHVL